MSGNRPLSPEALSRFGSCPLQFCFQDVERVLDPHEASVPTALGNAAHAALARLFRMRPAERNVEALGDALRFCWHAHCPHSLFTSREEEAGYGRECLGWLTRYAETTDLAAESVALECPLIAVLPGGARVWGRIDRIDRLRDGQFRVIDYKTDHRRIEEEDLRLEPAARIYLLLVQQQSGPVESVRFVYLTSGEELVWAPEPEDIPFIAESVAADVDGVWATQDYEGGPASTAARVPSVGLASSTGTRTAVGAGAR